MDKIQLFLVLVTVVCFANGAKILGFSPLPVPSHNILSKAVLRALAEAGHDVTVVTSYHEEKYTPKGGKWREILLNDYNEKFSGHFTQMTGRDRKTSFSLLGIQKMTLEMTETPLASPQVQDLIKSGEKFDVVIVNQFMNEAHYMLAAHFDAHLVVLSTIGSGPMNNYLVGNPSLPSVDRQMAINHPKRMNFYQRLTNTLVSIAAHPNMKAFWSHGGLLSTTETVYHGVPVLATPIYGDQAMNARLAQEDGYALVLPLSDITEQKLNEVLDEIIFNPRYRENVKLRSKIMRDRQVPPLDDAVYWVEYVIRHNGAEHLRMWYADMPWYQYFMVDVFLFIFTVIFITLYVIKKLCSLCCCRCKKVTRKIKKN